MIPQTQTTQSQTTATRLSYALIGAIAGLCAWALIEIVADVIDNARIVLLLVSSGLGFFGVLLGLLGPVRLVPAAAAALGMAVPAAALLLWASFRYSDVEGFLGRGYALAAFIYLLSISVPFVVAGLQRHGGWRHYGLLFDAAWELVVRTAAAWLFVGVVWTVLFLSDALLGLVGLNIIQDLIDIEPVPYLVSGLALGLGLAIVHELRDYVSPFLVIQLLRVLLPALLIVLAVFVAALPFRGLGNLFGQLSAAATLMAVTVAGITLVTTAIHRDDPLSVQGPVMRISAQVLSVMLPVPAVLALWAVWLRVDQYGLTPDRVAALVAAGVVSIYAVAYAGAVLRRRAWRAEQRRVNRRMALLTLVIAAAWLTPLLNAERLSTSSQLARATEGVLPEKLALWEMAHDWGKAGQRGLSRLEARAQDDTDLLTLINKARRTEVRWDYQSPTGDAAISPLAGIVPLRPEGRSLPPGALDALDGYDRVSIHEACNRRAPGGHPGCVMVIAPFEPQDGAEQVLGFFITAGSGVRIASYALQDGVLISEGSARDLASGNYPSAEPQIVTDILEGRFRIVPAPRSVLDVGGMQLFPQK
ncbi:DUF4153 domain-containing protein [Roseovarius sp. Pro17]|uniref:DUF4153 domain-containing protein n=1 Tax=Roseovarius sp. Pro17 TaxID=3108175 RepID=UPI002D7816EC|nr:hypothetical protein [Roseovarius sp. Pro17]